MNVLRQGFPVDQETSNFVRQVHNQVFNLLYILFRLDIILPFSSISSEVLTEILDLKTTARDGIDSFLRFLRKSDPAKRSFIVPQIRRTSGRERATASKKGTNIFCTVFCMNRKYIHKNSLLLRIRHTPLLYESTLGKRKINGQNWCATLFPAGSLSQFLINTPADEVVECGAIYLHFIESLPLIL